jgi:7-keto-8-aminopelargonate synthetase-like enzyme
MKSLAQKPEWVPAGTDDVFDKAFSFTRAEEAMAAGIYPYFKPISEQHGGTVKVDGREMIITGSNDYLGLTQDPRLEKAAVQVFDRYGTSCTGSRSLTARSPCTRSSSGAWPSSSRPRRR